jgi:hypothetical protein
MSKDPVRNFPVSVLRRQDTATVPVESYPTYFRLAMFPPAAVLSDGTSGRGQPAVHRLTEISQSPSSRVLAHGRLSATGCLDYGWTTRTAWERLGIVRSADHN